MHEITWIAHHLGFEAELEVSSPPLPYVLVLLTISVGAANAVFLLNLGQQVQIYFGIIVTIDYSLMIPWIVCCTSK